MKLIFKTSRYYLVFTLIIFGLGSLLYYFLIKAVLINSIDVDLLQEKEQIVNNLDYEKPIRDWNPDNNLIIYRTDLTSLPTDKFTTVELPDSSSQQIIDYRQLTGYFKYQGKVYEIMIRHSLAEAEGLLNGLFPLIILLFLLLLGGIFLINQFIYKKLWDPFYRILSRLKTYDLEKSKVIDYEESDIKEFDELSISVNKMTHKIYADYLNQKEFNENSSHELQTPVAIIGNKLDLLIQSKNLKEEELELVEGIYATLNKLKNLNKGLILLNKIENQQFVKNEEIDVLVKIKRILEEFSFQIERKSITLNSQLSPFSILTNRALFDILVSNIISNAIKHNREKGMINITLFENELLIENTGEPLEDDAEKMFARFKKNSTSQTSVGLGLSIVKKICQFLDYQVEYKNIGEIHSVRLRFK